MTKINMEDEYTTRDGRKVRILCVDRKHSIYPVVALVNSFGDGEGIETYRENGCYSGQGTNDLDLILVPRFKVGDIWLCRDGETTVEILKTGIKNTAYQLAGLITFSDRNIYANTWTSEGKYSLDGDSHLDLIKKLKPGE